MRKIVGYDQGRPIWSDNEPATPEPFGLIGGTLDFARGRAPSSAYVPAPKGNADLLKRMVSARYTALRGRKAKAA